MQRLTAQWFLLSHVGRTSTSGVMACDSPIEYSSLRAVRGWRLEFRVIWKIEIEANSPEEAAQAARAVQLRPDLSATLFDVWEHAQGRMHRIDVERQADRLTDDELTSVGTCLRLLQCAPGTHAEVKELVAVILMFLDREQWMVKRIGLRLLR